MSQVGQSVVGEGKGEGGTTINSPHQQRGGKNEREGRPINK